MSSRACRRLVVVRAGNASLHPGWLDGSEEPTFDVAVSYYGDDPNAFSDAALRQAFKGGKWDGLHAFFADNPGVFDGYDWIWLPDDDIATDAASINRLFDLAEKHDLDIAQPSLTWDSYFSHFITLQNPRFQLRWTNFAEIMVPIFRAAVLRKIFPVFAGRRFGTGLDDVWARWILEPYCRTAIIDSVAVRHTRPVGKGNLGTRDSASRAEMTALMDSYGLPKPYRVVYAALDTHGRVLERGPRLWLTLCAGWMPLRRHACGTDQFPLKTTRVLRDINRMVLRRFDLSPLPLPFASASRTQ